MTDSSNTRAGRHYRPDIDGLRAISILGVLVFHSFPEFARGGFVGVDVFFVISGFLIGGLIFAELDEGRFSFRHFYARRIRRIFPALIVVLVFAYVAGWFVLFPEEYRQLGKHLAGAATFLSNFVLLDEAGYFDATAATKPLLHLWSLAIEEQFYVLWPVYVWLMTRKPRFFLRLTIFLCAVSFALSVGLASRSVAFYSPVSRFWEIMSGSLLAYVGRSPSSPAIADKWKNVGAWLGLVLVFLAIFLTPEKEFPGWWAIPPVLGTCLLIFAGPNAWLNRHILALRPIVSIGTISYPLYLWHWPLLAFAWVINGSASLASVYGGGPEAATKVSLLAVSLILSYLTLFYVERPIRFGQRRGVKAMLAAGLMLLLGAVGLATVAAHGIDSRPVARINERLAEDLKIPTATRTSNESCQRLLGADLRGQSVCLANSANPTVMIYGDSQAMAMHSAIYAGRVSLPAVLLATNSENYMHPACLHQVDFDAWLKGDEPCQIVARNALRIVADTPSIRTVVVHFQSDNPFYLDRAKIERIQKAFLQAGKEVIYVLGEPGFWSPIAACRPRQIDVLGYDLSPAPRGVCRQERSSLAKYQTPQRQYIAELRRNDPNVFLYDPLPSFCDAQFCYQAGPEGALFWTLQHVNEKGSLRLLNDFLTWARSNLRSFGG
jgi:peptidoglycan/LPS O-acetylase OafA/YrhL